VLGIVAVAALLVGVPGNVAQANDYARRQRPVDDATRQLMLSIARIPLARRVPAALRPDPNRAPTLTLGWLLQGVASGRVPATRPSTPAEALTNRLRLSLSELDQPSGLACRPLAAPVVLHLDQGDRFGVVGKTLVILVGDATGRSVPVPFGVGLLNPSLAHTVDVVAGPLTIHIGPAGPSGRFGPALCGPAPGGSARPITGP